MKLKTYFYFVFLTSLLLVGISCSSNKEETPDDYRIVTLQPPAWIIGSWSDSDTNPFYIWHFTSGDAIAENYIESVVERFENLLNNQDNGSGNVVETIEDNRYLIRLNQFHPTYGQIIEEYLFVKDSDTQITWFGGPGPQGNSRVLIKN